MRICWDFSDGDLILMWKPRRSGCQRTVKDQMVDDEADIYQNFGQGQSHKSGHNCPHLVGEVGCVIILCLCLLCNFHRQPKFGLAEFHSIAFGVLVVRFVRTPHSHQLSTAVPTSRTPPRPQAKSTMLCLP